MAISKRLRFEILRRDGFKCVYCGAAPSENELHVDHVVPVALGGDDAPGNLVACCVDCNIGKASTSADAPPDLPDNYQTAVEEAAALRERREALLAQESLLVEEIQEEFRSYWKHPQTWPYANSVRGWLRDFTVTEIKEFIEIAVNKGRTQKSAVQYLAGIIRTSRAQREGRVQTCHYCGKWVWLEPGDDVNATWVHSECAKKARGEK